jgi:hypothetical protein
MVSDEYEQLSSEALELPVFVPTSTQQKVLAKMAFIFEFDCTLSTSLESTRSPVLELTGSRQVFRVPL